MGRVFCFLSNGNPEVLGSVRNLRLPSRKSSVDHHFWGGKLPDTGLDTL